MIKKESSPPTFCEQVEVTEKSCYLLSSLNSFQDTKSVPEAVDLRMSRWFDRPVPTAGQLYQEKCGLCSEGLSLNPSSARNCVAL